MARGRVQSTRDPDLHVIRGLLRSRKAFGMADLITMSCRSYQASSPGRSTGSRAQIRRTAAVRGGFNRSFQPRPENVKVYDQLFARYMTLKESLMPLLQPAEDFHWLVRNRLPRVDVRYA